MATTLRASATATPTPTARVMSAERGGSIKVSASGVLDLGGFGVVWGVSGGPPATFSDFSSSEHGNLPFLAGSASTTPHDGGSYTVDLVIAVPPADFTYPGDLWVAIFSGVGAGDPPGPTDAPDAVAGPFALIP